MAKPGRPTKYKKEYCQLLEEMLAQGKFAVTFCAEVGICEDTFYEWVKVHKPFSESYNRGKAASKALFMERVTNAAFDPDSQKVNNGMVTLLAVNVHGMKTKSEQTEHKVSTEDAVDALRELADKLPD